MDVEYEVVETGGAAGVEIGINSGCNTRDCSIGGNDADRIFTWAWSGHNNVRGFSYGSDANTGSQDSNDFLWEYGDENHAIPYTEVYIRLYDGACMTDHIPM